MKLNDVSWGKPALELLRYCNELDFSKPSIMVIRHSERDEPKEMEAVHRAQLTNTGRACAKHFGELLPSELKYQIYHSVSERTEDTAKEIHEGIIQNGGLSDLIGPYPILSHVLQYQNAFNEYLEKDGGDFFNNWISGLYPAYNLEESKLFAQRSANHFFNELRQENGKMKIFVSHDIFIMNYMFHWFGINLSSEWLRYLDGFIMQNIEDEIKVYYKKGEKTLDRIFWL